MSTLQLTPSTSRQALLSPEERSKLERRARRLAWGRERLARDRVRDRGRRRHAAGSIALVAFGVDSLIEVAAGLPSSGDSRDHASGRPPPSAAPRGSSLLVTSCSRPTSRESVRELVSGHATRRQLGRHRARGGHRADDAVLARAKRKVGHALGSAATVGEGGQNMICAYLSIALLVGLLANALVGWWWADPIAALVIGAVAAREGVESWRGEACCDHC